MKETTRDQSAADLAADLAYVRLKSGERPFQAYGEMLGLPGVVAKLSPRGRIPANEGMTAEQCAPTAPETTDNVVRLSDVRRQRQTKRV